MEPRSNQGSFSAFLEYMQKGKAEPQGSGPSPLKILAVLTEADQRKMPMGDLLKASRMDITDFAKAVESFRAASLISLSGPPGDEVVQLTESGTHMAKIA